MSASLFWHDYETFGADPSCDRASQFAGIRTDLGLNIIGEPLSLYCQPPKDILPHPEACLITGITPQMAQQKGLVEKEFITVIHREMAKPQTCSLGYNSIRFDDEVTRNTLFRNFYDPYEREWKNGNSRWDLIDMVRLVYALKPETLQWPAKSGSVEGNDFVPSFKLELLSKANHLNHDSAHDALSDVIATIELAKLIKTRQPDLYNYCWNLRLKKNVSALIGWQEHKPLLHVSSKIPASRACTTIIMPLMPHPTNSNGIIVIDLSVDPELWVHLNSDEIKQRLYMNNESLQEKGWERIPIKTIHINRSPIIATTKLIDKHAEQRIKINKDECSNNWHAYRHKHNLQALKDKLNNVFNAPFENTTSDPEHSLYSGGFLNSQDKQACDDVRSAEINTIKNNHFVFGDIRLQELFGRYKAINYKDHLSAEELTIWQEHCRQRLKEPSTASHLSYEQYHCKIEKLLSENINHKQKKMILDLKQWVEQLAQTCGYKA